MTSDQVADAVIHCPSGVHRLVNARQMTGDFVGLARRVAAGQRRAAPLLDDARADKDEAWRLYERHVAECGECRPREQVSA